MSSKYPYQPPFKYLFLGISCLLAAVVFGLGIDTDEIWFSLIILLFGLLTLTLGIGFLTLFIRNYNNQQLKIGDDYLEIPTRWKESIRIPFSEIDEIQEIDTYAQVLEIASNKEIYHRKKLDEKE